MTTTSNQNPSGGRSTRFRLDEGLGEILKSPPDMGRLEMIVRRPGVSRREVLEQAELDTAEGLVGDNWKDRGSSMTPDRRPHPGMQINIMNSRAIAVVAGDRRRWPLAGDQLYVDMDLSAANLPPGTRIALGSSVLEVTSEPHTGCRKFSDRFGVDAVKFVNSAEGRRLNLRGINARVVRSGGIRIGDLVRKVS
jgi:MOSC domain-containing protein YiiM